MNEKTFVCHSCKLTVPDMDLKALRQTGCAFIECPECKALNPLAWQNRDDRQQAVRG